METIPINISFMLPVPTLTTVVLYWLFGVYFMIYAVCASGVRGLRLVKGYSFYEFLFVIGATGFTWPYFILLLLTERFMESNLKRKIFSD